MTRYGKAVIALIGSLATWGTVASEDGVYTQTELWGALLALATAAGVYQWDNGQPVEDGEAGHSDSLTLIVVAVLLLVILLALGIVPR